MRNYRHKRTACKTYLSTTRVGNTDIAASSHVRNSGVWFNERFSIWRLILRRLLAQHFIISTIYMYGELRNIFHKILQKLLFTPLRPAELIIVTAFWLDRLPSFQISKMQRVQHAAARVVFMKSKYCHITPPLRRAALAACHLNRIQFKVILITFKALHKMAPSYISSLLRVRQNTR